LQQSRHVHLVQRPDDLVDVAARAEVAALAGEHDRLDVGGVHHLAEKIAQFAVRIERQRVLLVGAIQRDRRDLAVDRVAEVLRLVFGQIDLFHVAFLRSKDERDQPTIVRPPLTDST
jgi:hypothetical protein